MLVSVRRDMDELQGFFDIPHSMLCDTRRLLRRVTTEGYSIGRE